MLDSRQVRAFVTVVRERSFTRAASVLHYAQSSVTAQVQQLENQLGVPLLDRLPGRVELTSAGEGFLVYAERLLTLETEACQSVLPQGEPAGTLTLSVCESVLTYRLPDLLRTFQDRYPKVKVELYAAGLCEIGPTLAPNVDIAVNISQPISDSQMIVERLVTERICAVVSSDHPLAGRRKVSPGDIVAEQLLLTGETCSYREIFEKALSSANARASRTLEFASVEAIKQCAKARMGIAILPEMVVHDDLRAGVLIALPWPSRSLLVYTQLLRHRGKWVSPAMRAFWDTATEMLREPHHRKASSEKPK